MGVKTQSDRRRENASMRFTVRDMTQLSRVIEKLAQIPTVSTSAANLTSVQQYAFQQVPLSAYPLPRKTGRRCCNYKTSPSDVSRDQQHQDRIRP